MNKIIDQVADAIILVFFFLLINARSFVFWPRFPDVTMFSGAAWLEVPLWLSVEVLILGLLWKYQGMHDLLSGFTTKPILIIFILFSLLSVVWSVSRVVTFHRLIVFIFATFSAAYISFRYTLNEFLRILFWFGFVVILASFAMVFFSPFLGTDLNPPYNGAWRGLFWHKNHLGNLVPLFSLVFLFRIYLGHATGNKFEYLLAIPLYVASLYMLYRTDSASGYVIAVLLHLAFFIAWLWIKLASKLRPIHYSVLAVVSVLLVIVAWFNFDLIFGLLNRSPNLTGRIPLWMYLFQSVVLQAPLLGHGFGTIWADLSFRLKVTSVVRWPYPVLIGDNGFLDVLLNLGFVGLGLFLLVYVQGFIRSIRGFVEERLLMYSFPMIFMLYLLIANLSYSLLMETELFVWTTFVILILMEKNKAGNFGKVP